LCSHSAARRMRARFSRICIPKESVDKCRAGLELQLLFDDGDQHIGTHCAPDLGLHSILACAQKVLDAQVLLDPFEEELDLPAVFVQGCDGGGRQAGVVGQKDQRLTCGGVGKPDASHVFGIIGEVDKRWDCARKVQKGVDLYRRLGRAKQGPRKKAHAQVDGAGGPGRRRCSSDPTPGRLRYRSCALFGSTQRQDRPRFSNPCARWLPQAYFS
jgi:hypothetical protein